jgi:geranylgeranyl diphosphate synthase type I
MTGSVIKAHFARKKERILPWLTSFLEQEADYLCKQYTPELPSGINGYLTWRRRLEAFLSEGKMIRGGLVLITEEFYRGTVSSGALAAASAMELMQAGLLIHDDIMDRDILRRGALSLYHQYQLLSRERGLRDPDHSGESLGICLGDIAFFLAMQALGQTGHTAMENRNMWTLISREFNLVALAQMRDVVYGASLQPVPLDDLIRLYACKTGRYTFSLPMMLGAILGGARESRLEMLSLFGEELGIVFQLKDDEIGLFGDPVETGKPADSDLAEGKQTVLMSLILKRLSGKEREKVLTILKSGSPSREDGDFVRRCAEDSGALGEVRRLMEEYAGRAEARLPMIAEGGDGPADAADGGTGLAVFLRGLIAYSLERRS